MLSVYGEQFGLDRELALKIACAFGGGIARMGKTCGAVSGGLMVIGLKYGRSTIEDKEAREKTYALSNEFVKMFESRNGSIVCKDLLGVDIGTPEGSNAAREKNLFITMCPEFVKDAAEILFSF